MRIQVIFSIIYAFSNIVAFFWLSSNSDIFLFNILLFVIVPAILITLNFGYLVLKLIKFSDTNTNKLIFSLINILFLMLIIIQYLIFTKNIVV